MFLYIGGVPGVGKSTAINILEAKAIQEKVKIKKMAGAPILCELAGLKTTEELRRLPEERREKLRPKMYDIIYDILKQEPDILWIFDGHFCYFDWSGKKFSVRSIQSWDKELMAGIVVLTARPETILSRRVADKRLDRKLDIDFIKKEIEKEREAAISQSAELNKPIVFLVNENGDAEKIAKNIIQLTREWM